MKKLCFLKRMFSPVTFPYYCRLRKDHNADFHGARSQSREGDALQIVHLPLENDQSAVFAYSIPLNRIIGRFSDHSAKLLIKALGKGFCVDGEIYVWMPEQDDFRIETLTFDKRSFMDNDDFSTLHDE